MAMSRGLPGRRSVLGEVEIGAGLGDRFLPLLRPLGRQGGGAHMGADGGMQREIERQRAGTLRLALQIEVAVEDGIGQLGEPRDGPDP